MIISFIFFRGMQWNSPKNAAKTGGPAGGWTPQPMAATTGAGYRPMVSSTNIDQLLNYKVISTLNMILLSDYYDS